MTFCTDDRYAGRHTLVAGTLSTCVIEAATGAPKCWGFGAVTPATLSNGNGYLVPPSGLTSQVGVTVGSSHGCSVSTTSTLTC